MEDLIAELVRNGVLDADAATFLRGQLDREFARNSAEERIFNAVLAGLQRQQQAVLSGVSETTTVSQVIAAFDDATDILADAAMPEIRAIASERAVSQAVTLSPSLTGGAISLTDEALEAAFNTVNEAVLEWADTYYLSLADGDVGSLPNLNVTTRSRFLDVFNMWNRGELPNQGAGLADLTEALGPVFGPERAELIASTETTRIFGEATKRAARASGVVTGLTWITAADERVCPICLPLDGMTVDVDSDTFEHPQFGSTRFPAHPRCRCDLLPQTELTVERTGVPQ